MDQDMQRGCHKADSKVAGHDNAQVQTADPQGSGEGQEHRGQNHIRRPDINDHAEEQQQDVQDQQESHSVVDSGAQESGQRGRRVQEDQQFDKALRQRHHGSHWGKTFHALPEKYQKLTHFNAAIDEQADEDGIDHGHAGSIGGGK